MIFFLFLNTVAHPQPPYAAAFGATQTPKPQPQISPPTQPQPATIISGPVDAPIGRSVSSVSGNTITLLQPPITNKESLTDDDIRIIEEHNRKVRIFLQQRQAELAAEQERARRQKLAEEAVAKAQQEAAQQERMRRIKAEQEAAATAAAEQERIARIKAEQEAAARAAAEQERIRKIKAEQEAAARAAAEQERIRRIKAEQEAAMRAAAEQERIARIRAEQERIRRLREEQEAAARAAAEQERIRRLKAEQEAVARIAAEQDRMQKIREEQEMAARAAAEQDRLRRIHEEQYQKMKLDQEHDIERERQGQLRAQQEAAIRLAEAERSRLQRIQAYQNAQLITNANLSANSLAYQPEPSLALDEASLINKQPNVLRTQLDNAGLVDAARVRAEKEALAEQERLLRFQASQQALAQQQSAEQNRLRRLREEELLHAEEERLLREAQERQILRARNEQNRLIMAARDAAHRDPATLSYTPYSVEDLHKYQTNNMSLNNVRTPESSSRSGGAALNRIDNNLPSMSKNATQFKPAKISLQELPPDLDRDGIPGVAGRDYPTLIEIPKTSFSCARQPLNGYYADTGKLIR